MPRMPTPLLAFMKPRLARRIPLVPTVCALATLLLALPPLLDAASLTPSRSALMRQVRAARSHAFTYLENEAQVRRFVDEGYLVRVPGGSGYAVKSTVRFPYARPEVKLFVERLGDQYRDACGEKLVVTSLVRPKNSQPRNSSRLSVHPTGMAMDLRLPGNRTCRSFLERVLLSLEARGVLEAARERYPPHYHVVLFPREYRDYLESTLGVDMPETGAPATYRVSRGDSLWSIARRHGVSVDALRRTNGLRSTLLKPGQVLEIPAG